MGRDTGMGVGEKDWWDSMDDGTRDGGWWGGILGWRWERDVKEGRGTWII